jgi:hypothetical protein
MQSNIALAAQGSHPKRLSRIGQRDPGQNIPVQEIQKLPIRHASAKGHEK